jgi:DNA-binding SARP family transcriptional activator
VLALVTIHVLGALAVVVEGIPLPLGTPKQRAVMSLLAVNPNRVVGIEEFVDELWSGSPPPSAVANVRTYAANLRRSFESVQRPLLIRESGGYRLRISEDAVDLFVHERLQEQARLAWSRSDLDLCDALLARAEALWRGPMLAGVPLGPFLAARRTATDEERSAAVELRTRVHLRQGRTREALLKIRDHVQAHPLRESAHALLIRALYEGGDPAGAVAAFGFARTQLVEHLAIEPGPALQSLYRAVLNRERLPSPEADLPAGPGIPSSTQIERVATAAVPASVNWLPRAVPHFVGRAELINRMVQEIDADSTSMSPVRVIDGMAGAGKTTFVVHLARRLSDRYPDAQLFIDLRGYAEGEPMESAAALVGLLRQLGVPAVRVPTEFEHRVALWRREIAVRRAVVVLDNAASTDQISPLLPTTPGSVVLVTTRRRLPALEARPPEPLPILTEEKAIRLLALTAGEARVNREPDAAREVVRRCGCLPLAIRLAGARLAQRRSWSVAELVHRLKGQATVIPELAAEQQTVARAFAASYKPLTDTAKHVFRMLSVHPGGHFDVAMAAALADLPSHRASAAVDELLDQHLIDEVEDGRLRMHDLMRQYSVEISVQAQVKREAAAKRLLDHKLHATVWAAQPLEPRLLRAQTDLAPPLRPDLVGATGEPDAEWLERERAEVVSLVVFASENGH